METAFDQWWHLILGALSLNRDAFVEINILPLGRGLALTIVLVAGVSQAIGQSIVLFINRVRPFRFVLSLGMAAILFVFTFWFWAASIWLVHNAIFNSGLNLQATITTLGLSYAPQILRFIVGLPYFGVPIGVFLSIWSLLAEVTAIKAVTNFDTWATFSSVGLGWVLLQILQRTIGSPLMILGQKLTNLVAGTEVVTDRQKLTQMVISGNIESIDDVGNEVILDAATRHSPETIKRNRAIQLIALGLTGFFVFVLISSQSPGWFSRWYNALEQTLQLAIDLTTIGLIALFFSIFLTPLEALSWWAGWYGDRTLKYTGTPVKEIENPNSISRYVMYLDGINQGSHEYLPQVENMLDKVAESLPDDILIVKGIMPYSVTNKPLTSDRPLSFIWQIIESISLKNPANPIAFIINFRNVVSVAIAADPRYGPIQNQGLAQVIYNSLISFGYPLGSGKPITLIGYSGGGQMSMGAVSFLKYNINAPIEVISLAGVISGNTGAMAIQRLYHLVGEKDNVEKLGPIMFSGRWPISVLSNWNCAKRRGRIILISLGPVGHNGDDGPMGDALLPDGRTHLEQTVQIITGILCQNWEITGLDPQKFITISEYERYKQGLFNQVGYYPIQQRLNPELYHPNYTWIGRLILPSKDERETLKGVRLEIYHADPENQHRIGQVVILRWSDEQWVQNYSKLLKMDVNFSDQARLSQRQGKVHPHRLDGWENVDPLESLAGARPDDDMIVALREPVVIKDTGEGVPVVYIQREPMQISGRFYGVVRFVKNLGNDLFQVRHFNPSTGDFDGYEEIVYMPTVIPNRNGVYSFNNQGVEESPVNSGGWYIYGARNKQGRFTVQAIAPREMFRLSPQRVIHGLTPCLDYFRRDYLSNLKAEKGQMKNVLLSPHNEGEDDHMAISQWREGDRALMMHLFGGIGGKKAELASMKIYFGHFAFGVATVKRDPLTGELRFAIEYRQIYTNNTDGIISGANAWEHYGGDRQWGWLGVRPLCETLIKFSPLTEDYDFDGIKFSPLNAVIQELDIMAARYRVGDGTGTTFVSPVNSCCQDSSQALYSSLRQILAELELNPLIIKWMREHPNHEQTLRFQQLGDLLNTLEHYLTPMGKVRPDWRFNAPKLGDLTVEKPRDTLIKALSSWRTLLPRWVHDQIAMIFLQLGADLWMLRTNQVGGFDPDIEPVAPTYFRLGVPHIKPAKKNWS
ncbi:MULTISPECIES: Yip1 family protein [Limnospira]|uniref:Protease of the Abi (CAAX) family-like protein n=1 Tax=Limnospira maxima CS-328 TaxID=513049 RepID=B5W6N1_LIMMA|nr:peptidase [Limnospira maxima]EDZ92772.1 protease of the Abi (CAAX) family-like protein [Limnospira maxima CS-328]MDC0836483.1 peptidase [Limnoraphis robusta]QJB28010.1 peptidase [Limnospira fusiformis SAG 85.79]